MELIKIGEIVNTHGIKGELRILSKFPYKEKVFIKNMKVYIDKKNIIKNNCYAVVNKKLKRKKISYINENRENIRKY